MEELKDLQKMSENAVARFNSYSGADFVLPSIFKEQVKSIIVIRLYTTNTPLL